jgi:curved DNA-binding protein CbpA
MPYYELAEEVSPRYMREPGEERFKEINAAYEVLSDSQAREKYDLTLSGIAGKRVRSPDSAFAQDVYTARRGQVVKDSPGFP